MISVYRAHKSDCTPGMICQRCVRRVARQSVQSSVSIASRRFSQTVHERAQAVSAQTTTATNPRPSGHPAATSTSAAQPFSTPETLAPENLDLPINTKQSKQPLKIESSVPAGTVLKGLNFMKNQQDPVAMEDHEYPAWLWNCLQSKSGEAGAEEEAAGDLFSKSKKQRRIAAKALKRKQLLNPEALAPKVPLYEQTVDLASGSAAEAGHARQELTKAMRAQRRSKIKETNFLKEMG